MDRRSFFRAVAVTGGAGAGLATVAHNNAHSERSDTKPSAAASVEWTVQGFYCPTCAIGLETLLQRDQAIRKVTAEYPSGRVRIAYDARKIQPSALVHSIEEAGFKVIA